MKSLHSAKKGDILAHSDGSKCMVLFKIEDCIGRSKCYNFSLFHCIETIDQMEKEGFMLLYDGQMPIRLKEAEKLLGMKIITK